MQRYISRRGIPGTGDASGAASQRRCKIQINFPFGEYHQNGKRRLLRDSRHHRAQTNQIARMSEEQYRFSGRSVPQQVWTAAQPDGELVTATTERSIISVKRRNRIARRGMV